MERRRERERRGERGREGWRKGERGRAALFNLHYYNV